MSRLIDLTGKRFGKWIVLGKGTWNKKENKWICRCDCGRELEVFGHSLRRGESEGCRECFCDSIRLEKGMSSKKRVYSKYRRVAKAKGRKFELSFDEFLKITSYDCFYCGAKPSNLCMGSRAYGGFTYQGIDRVNNDKGYVAGNVVPCCRLCNMAKKNMSCKEFIEWIKRVSAYKIWTKAEFSVYM